MIKLKRRFKHKAEINITALVDLIFLLVSFFMVTSSLSTTSSISIQLPKAVQTGVQKQGDMVITVDKQNNIYLNDIRYEPDQLKNQLTGRKNSGEASGSSVIIKGDRNSNYETIVKVMDILNQAGFPKFSLTTITGED